MNGMITDILGLKSQIFKSLVETKDTFGLKTVGLASAEKSEKDLKHGRRLGGIYRKGYERRKCLQTEDFVVPCHSKSLWHSTMQQFMLTITGDPHKFYNSCLR